jgi:hypothetical protein
MLKRELGLHLIWSRKSAVILAQVWACLIIAQVLQAIRMEVALRTEVDAFDVSLPLLIEALPQFGLQGLDGIVECVRQGRRLGIIGPSTRLRIQAPQIPRQDLIPLPRETVLCRQPCYHDEASSDKPMSPHIEVHPQRDQLVAILLQREAQLKAAARQTNKAEQTPQSKAVPVTSNTDQKNVPKATATASKRPPVQPDPGIVRPSWAFLQPLVA